MNIRKKIALSIVAGVFVIFGGFLIWAGFQGKLAGLADVISRKTSWSEVSLEKSKIIVESKGDPSSPRKCDSLRDCNIMIVGFTKDDPLGKITITINLKTYEDKPAYGVKVNLDRDGFYQVEISPSSEVETNENGIAKFEISSWSSSSQIGALVELKVQLTESSPSRINLARLEVIFTPNGLSLKCDPQAVTILDDQSGITNCEVTLKNFTVSPCSYCTVIGQPCDLSNPGCVRNPNYGAPWPNQIIKISTNREKDKIEPSEIVTDSQGKGRFKVSSQEFGQRIIRTEASPNYLAEFEVKFQALISGKYSQFTASPTSVAANGEESAYLTVKIFTTSKQEYTSDPYISSLYNIEIISDRGSKDQITKTGSNGIWYFKVTSTTPGKSTFSATAITSDGRVPLQQKASVEFLKVAKVISTSPKDKEENVPVINPKITATFDNPINPNDPNFRFKAFYYCGGECSLKGEISYDSATKTLIFLPEGDLKYGETHYVEIRHLYGLVEYYKWQFKTSPSPRIISTYPKKDAKDVPIDIKITGTFDQDLGSVDRFNVYLFLWRGSYPQVPGQLSYDPKTRTFTFVPNQLLEYSSLYRVNVQSKIHGIFSYEWYFSTVASTTKPPINMPPVIGTIIVKNIFTDSATIEWETDQDATSQVEYGQTTSYGQATGIDLAYVRHHSMVISALSPGETYHFRVKSKNKDGYEGISGDQTFTTLREPEKPKELKPKPEVKNQPPSISNPTYEKKVKRIKLRRWKKITSYLFSFNIDDPDKDRLDCQVFIYQTVKKRIKRKRVYEDQLVKILVAQGQELGRITLEWDGTNLAGRKVKRGKYKYQIKVFDPSNNNTTAGPFEFRV